ncbi:hypothetical protein FGG08_004370 [Glutinoglossum americanum]|uniref:Protein kinase domain-containing protein n=1 Tax=Glutinoglossum americanum TaxID=1670608 RepID=A0A9P8L2T2_9PEZI|nr:hypothetical protein FGG08_004370 [Glutinoglossum americanum]
MEQFIMSLDGASRYPLNLIYHTTHEHNLEAYFKRLNDREEGLFSVEYKASLDFWDFDELEQDELEKKLRVRASPARNDPRCRFLFVHAPSSRERLRATREMLMLSFTYHQVIPAYLDFLFPFGRQVYQRDFHFSGFRHEKRLTDSEGGLRIPELGRSGRDLRLCYSLKSVEPSGGNPDRPWSIRQTAIYHSFDMETGVATWILTKGNELMRDRVQSATGRRGPSELTSFGTVDGAVLATLATHLIFCNWSGENWRWYINFLEEALQDETRRVLFATVDSPKSPVPEKIILNGTELMTPPMPPSAPTFPPSPPEVSRRPNGPRGTSDQQGFSFSQLQRVQFIEDKANETLLVLKANVSVLSELKHCYRSLFDSGDCSKELAVRCKAGLTRFESRITSVENDLWMQQSRVETLLRLLADRKSLACVRVCEMRIKANTLQLYGILKYRSFEANTLLAQKNTLLAEKNTLLAEKAQQSTDKMEKMTREMQVIARKTKQETVSMRIITLVTLFFLPGTFISATSRTGDLGALHSSLDTQLRFEPSMSRVLAGTATMSVSQPDHDPAVQGFLSWFGDACVKGTLGPVSTPNQLFMPSMRLTGYLNDSIRLRRILEALFGNSDLPTSPEEIQGKYEKIFGILLRIGRGRYITHFVEYQLRDEKLPFDNRPTHFPTESGDDHFFEDFCDQQWIFCPPTFQRGEVNVHYDSKRILPIIYKEELCGGSSANVYKIILHKSYDRLSRSEQSPANAKQGPSDRFANTFVLKTYKNKDAKQYYKNEVDGFKRIQSGGWFDPNMICFYGSYIQDDSYNVLLDYADRGTLEEHFQRSGQPPAEHIIPFWRELFSVIKPVMRIHEVSPDGLAEYPAGMQIFQGWYQDIKPSNIFVKSDTTSPLGLRFILADLGLSHFKSKIPSQNDVADKDTRGTRTCGDPKCYRSDDVIDRIALKVKQKVDIWSLACVFSISATWVLRGHDGIIKFRQLRMEETAKIDGFRDHDCFHNGEEVLKVVDEWHEKISIDIRWGDRITAGVLELIKEMFWDSNSRPDAVQLWKKSQEIIKKAEGPAKSFPSQSQNEMFLDRSESPPHTPPMLPPDTQFSFPRPPWRPAPNAARRRGEGLGILGGLEGPAPQYNPDRVIDADGSPARAGLSKKNTGRHLPDYYPARGVSASLGNSDGRWNINSQSRGLTIGVGPVTTPPRVLREPTGDSNGSYHRQSHSIPRALSVRATNGRDLFSDFQYSGGPVGHRVDSDALTSGLGRTLPATDTPALQSPSTRLQDTPFQQGPPIADSPEGQSLSAGDPPPLFSVLDADRLVASMKGEGKWGKSKTVKKKFLDDLPDSNLLDRLNGRDHVFLIDDGISMQSHWRNVVALFKTLGYLVKQRDPDGMELCFTNSLKEERSKDRKRLLELLGEVVPKGNTDISIRLGSILLKYEERLINQSAARPMFRARPTGSAPPLSLYIFTDGVWQPECDVTFSIKKLVTKLEDLGSPPKQVGIQFIRFGDNPEGIKRLDYLDSELGMPRDIIDTEPFSGGNVWKMFLGPIDPWFDDDKKRKTRRAGDSYSAPNTTGVVNGTGMNRYSYSHR